MVRHDFEDGGTAAQRDQLRGHFLPGEIYWIGRVPILRSGLSARRLNDISYYFDGVFDSVDFSKYLIRPAAE